MDRKSFNEIWTHVANFYKDSRVNDEHYKLWLNEFGEWPQPRFQVAVWQHIRVKPLKFPSVQDIHSAWEEAKGQVPVSPSVPLPVEHSQSDRSTFSALVHQILIPLVELSISKEAAQKRCRILATKHLDSGDTLELCAQALQ